jgi:hypothetical protein
MWRIYSLLHRLFDLDYVIVYNHGPFGVTQSIKLVHKYVKNKCYVRICLSGRYFLLPGGKTQGEYGACYTWEPITSRTKQYYESDK